MTDDEIEKEWDAIGTDYTGQWQCTCGGQSWFVRPWPDGFPNPDENYNMGSGIGNGKPHTAECSRLPHKIARWPQTERNVVCASCEVPYM